MNQALRDRISKVGLLDGISDSPLDTRAYIESCIADERAAIENWSREKDRNELELQQQSTTLFWVQHAIWQLERILRRYDLEQEAIVALDPFAPLAQDGSTQCRFCLSDSSTHQPNCLWVRATKLTPSTV